MGFETDIELLSKVAMFRDFSVEQLRLIAFGTERQRLATGEELFADGDPAQGGYVVAKGQVELVSWSGAQAVVLDVCSEGSLIGELALISPNRRVGTAISRGESEVMYIPRALFHRMLGEYPEMAVAIQGRIVESVTRTMQALEKVGMRMSSIPPLPAHGDRPFAIASLDGTSAGADDEDPRDP